MNRSLVAKVGRRVYGGHFLHSFLILQGKARK
jgi:hypothetical protein